MELEIRTSEKISELYNFEIKYKYNVFKDKKWISLDSLEKSLLEEIKLTDWDNEGTALISQDSIKMFINKLKKMV